MLSGSEGEAGYSEVNWEQAFPCTACVSPTNLSLSPQLLKDIGSADILAWLLEQPGCEDLANVQDIGGYTPAHDAVESE